VQVRATCAAGAGHNIVGVHIYVDNVDTWSETANAPSVSIAPLISMANGTRDVVVQAWDDSAPQNIYKAPVTISVVAGGCSVSSPGDGTTEVSPVTVAATCSAATGHKLVGVHVYVDGNDTWSEVTSATSVSFSQALPMDPGTHAITVQAWDDSTAPQVIYKSPVSVTVPAGGCTVAAPADGSGQISPVPFDATCAAGTGHNIVGVHVYVDTVDSWSSGTTTGNQVRVTPSVAMTTGTHAVTVQAWDDSTPQIIYKTHLSVNATQPVLGCAVRTPVDGSTVSSPVAFDATCTVGSGHNVVGVHVYVDSVSAWASGTTTGNPLEVTPSVAMDVGTHAVTVQAWDDSAPQNIYKTNLSVTVSPPPPPPTSSGNGDNSAAGFVSTWTAETGANGANPKFGTDSNTTTTANGNTTTCCGDVTVNGNLTPPANISRVPHSKLFPTVSGPIFVHLMPWFNLASGQHSHVGYSSNDPAVVDAQIKDMVERGIGGVIADWYGPTRFEDTSMLVWKAEANKYNAGQLAFQNGVVPATPFWVAIEEDQGSPTLDGCTASTCADKLAQDLNYIVSTYETQSFYPHDAQGRPLIFFFDMPSKHPVDWTALRSKVPGQAFIQENGSGFTTGDVSDGAFPWPQAAAGKDPEDWGSAYLADYWAKGRAHPSAYAQASAWKGFDGSAETWNHGLINQHCGQVWLDSAATASSSGRSVDSVQIATWNDYQEGTSIEPGIDNCLSDVTVTLTGTTLSWTPEFTADGSTNTVDHFTVWARTSTDQMINASGPLPVTATSFNLAGAVGLTSGTTYRLYVKAVGKPSIKNVRSSNDAVNYTP
jgi:hypothetical protein